MTRGQANASYIGYIVFGGCILFLTVAGVTVAVIIRGPDANSTPLLASLIGFAGTVLALFTAIHASATAAVNATEARDQSSATAAQVQDVQAKVDGHLSALTTAVTDAAAKHPDVAVQVQELLPPSL